MTRKGSCAAVAVIAARLRPMANAEAARNFMGFSFLLGGDKNAISDDAGMTSGPDGSPAMMVPMPTMPTPVTAMPVMAAPAPVTMTMMPVVAPTDLFGLEVIDFALRNHGGFDGLVPRRHKDLPRRDRRQRRGLRARRERGRACNKSNAEF
jgi:hypothetical protein